LWDIVASDDKETNLSTCLVQLFHCYGNCE
jgi:hypothetical protein